MVSKRGSSEAFGTKSFKLFLRILGSSKKRSKDGLRIDKEIEEEREEEIEEREEEIEEERDEKSEETQIQRDHDRNQDGLRIDEEIEEEREEEIEEREEEIEEREEESEEERDEKSEETQKRLLVSNLRLHSLKSHVYDYICGVLKENVCNISFNAWERKVYNNSCIVTMDSIEAANRVLVQPPHTHVIDNCQVNVQRYVRKKDHPKLLKKGKFEMCLDDMNDTSHLCKFIEDTLIKGGFSNIEVVIVNDRAKVSLGDENDKARARAILTSTLNCKFVRRQK